jgi:Phage integrase, N-terminal SAM-like domain
MCPASIPLARPAQSKRRLLDQVRDTIRRKHYSLRTEAAYADWIRRYILFHQKRHPAEMGKERPETRLISFKRRAAS